MTSKEQIKKIVQGWKPLRDRLIVVPKIKDKQSESGLLLSESKMGEDIEQEGEVLAIGPGRIYESGTRVPMDVKVGDRVLFALHSGDTVYIDENGKIHRGIGDLREEWLAVKFILQDSILSIL